MTNDSDIFKSSEGSSRLPLFEGKMIWHFRAQIRRATLLVEEKAARKRVLGREADTGQMLDYRAYRLGFRDIAANTNERTLVSTIIPRTFHGNKLPTVSSLGRWGRDWLIPKYSFSLAGYGTVFVLDWMIRQKVTTTLNFFLHLPTPRSAPDGERRGVWAIVTRAAKLICTTPEFDDLATKSPWQSQARRDRFRRTRPVARGVDGLVAQLYGLTESEFALHPNHLPSSSPTCEGCRAGGLSGVRAKIRRSTVGRRHRQGRERDAGVQIFRALGFQAGQASKVMEQVIVKTAAAFLNSEGGTLLIGVDDDGKVLGLENDYKNLQKQCRQPALEAGRVFVLPSVIVVFKT